MSITLRPTSGIVYPDNSQASSGGGATPTGAFNLPSGTTSQRPANAANGAIRFNTSNNIVEVYIGSSWSAMSGSYNVLYLSVAGGGGGSAAGGGAGGLLSDIISLTSGSTYTITIGAGAAAGKNNGGNTTISGTGINTITCVGGGGGGADTNYGSGGNGGEGGGGGANLANQNGVTNTGGGGGGSWNGASVRAAGSGGSGIVIFAYTNTSQRATGGTVTSATIDGQTHWVHTFTTSGTFVA